MLLQSFKLRLLVVLVLHLNVTDCGLTEPMSGLSLEITM